MNLLKALRYLATLRYFALVIALSGCGLSPAITPEISGGFGPAFAHALPQMGFSAAAAHGYLGQNARVLVVDVFNAPNAHGWTVVESLSRAAPLSNIRTLNLYDYLPQTPFDPFVAAHALSDAVEQAPHILNLSLTWRRPHCNFESDPGTAMMKHLIDELVAQGTVVVAAAGNEGSHQEAGFPACLPNVIGVGSVYDRTDFEQMWPANPRISRAECTDRPVFAGMPICFSNQADVYAPGSLTGFQSVNVEWFQGTSASTPLVSAALAVTMSAGFDPYAALERLLLSANPSHNAPKVDLVHALNLSSK